MTLSSMERCKPPLRTSGADASRARLNRVDGGGAALIGRKAAVIGSVTTLSAFAPGPCMFATMCQLADIGLAGRLPNDC